MVRYAIITERYENGYGAYVPGLPGCGATGQSEDEVRQRIRTAIEIHIRSMREDGEPIPEARSLAETVEVAA